MAISRSQMAQQIMKPRAKKKQIRKKKRKKK